MNRGFTAGVLIFISLFATSCFLRTSTTTVRGKVTYDNKPVVGAEVRFGGKMGEDVTRTDHDGRFTLTAKHRPTEMLEIKVLWPGYTHNEIKFPGFTGDDKPINIELKKVFTPIAPTR